MRKLILLGEAASDIELAASFYDFIERGVGDYFVGSILGDIRLLERFPGTHRVHFGFHRALCSKFPFAIYYKDDEASRRVGAVLDLRRDPEVIRRILTDR